MRIAVMFGERSQITLSEVSKFVRARASVSAVFFYNAGSSLAMEMIVRAEPNAILLDELGLLPLALSYAESCSAEREVAVLLKRPCEMDGLFTEQTLAAACCVGFQTYEEIPRLLGLHHPDVGREMSSVTGRVLRT